MKRLVDNDRLSHSVTDFAIRNQLIKQLDLTSKNDHHHDAKYALAFWLGSSPTLWRLIFESKGEQFRCLYAVYFCLLVLDKYISLLPRDHHETNQLSKAFRKMLSFYNENFDLFLNNPEKLVNQFIAILKSIKESHTNKREDKIVSKAKTLALNELNRFVLNIADFTNPCNELYDVENFHPYLERPSFENFKVHIINNEICHLFDTDNLHLFYWSDLYADNKQLLINKFFLPAHDGVILDGLYAKKRKSNSSTVALSLIGHFQSETNYISGCINSFQQIFDTDIVFMNHRNYSTRSAKFADSTDELAEDIVSFANYFHKQGKQVVLYGMCGGTAPVLLACKKLTEQNIPYKVIVDRFSQHYLDFITSKTILRFMDRNGIHTPYERINKLLQSKLGLKAATILWDFIVQSLKVLSYATHMNTNFADRLLALPESNVLVLQAKGKKLPGQKEPFATDLIVHPDNDLRHAVKERRHAHRILLNDLEVQSQTIADYFINEHPLHSIFLQFAECFNECIQLIDNEKLKYINKCDVYTDLHSDRIFDLTTRNNLPINRFFQGFFNKLPNNWHNKLEQLLSYDTKDFKNFGKDTNCFLNKDQGDKFIHSLQIFFEKINANKEYLVQMTNRLFLTGMTNINKTIEELFKTDLFIAPSNQPLP